MAPYIILLTPRETNFASDYSEGREDSNSDHSFTTNSTFLKNV